jgi:siroheme synthase-like protein
MKKEKPSYYPIFMNVRGKKCVVIGGGQVALRKVRSLLEYGACVEVISPVICPELDKMNEKGEISVIRADYQPGGLPNALLAIAATDNDKRNLEVARESRNKGILVNVVDCAENSDFILPSYLRRGDVTIAVSTSGRSPALARKIRTKLENEFGDEYASLALLIGEVRAEVKQKGINVNGDDWQESIDLDLMTGQLRKGDKEKIKAGILDRLRKVQK